MFPKFILWRCLVAGGLLFCSAITIRAEIFLIYKWFSSIMGKSFWPDFHGLKFDAILAIFVAAFITFYAR